MRNRDCVKKCLALILSVSMALQPGCIVLAEETGQETVQSTEAATEALKAETEEPVTEVLQTEASQTEVSQTETPQTQAEETEEPVAQEDTQTRSIRLNIRSIPGMKLRIATRSLTRRG